MSSLNFTDQLYLYLLVRWDLHIFLYSSHIYRFHNLDIFHFLSWSMDVSQGKLRILLKKWNKMQLYLDNLSSFGPSIFVNHRTSDKLQSQNGWDSLHFSML